MTDLKKLLDHMREVAGKRTQGYQAIHKHTFSILQAYGDDFLATVTYGHGDDTDFIVLAERMFDALLDVAEEAIKSQARYLKENGDWYDTDLDEALVRLSEVKL